jgi:protein required for attachment to host cells
MELTLSELFLEHGIWLAVCDGKKALLLENRGNPEFPKLETRETFQQDNPPTHEQGSAPPGRVFSSAGRRAATEESDFHQQQEAAFLSNFAQVINRRAATGQISALALVAPARALGLLRPHLSTRARKLLVAELARDYMKMPVYEIERTLSRLGRTHH